jgi:hypothetical protein
MKNRQVRGRIALFTLAALLALPGLALAEGHHDSDVFSQVMRAIEGKDCPLISDPAGNAGLNPMDFTALFVTNDNVNVYFLVQYAGDASKNELTVLYLNTDKNQATGCQLSIAESSGRDAGIFLVKKGSGPDQITRIDNGCNQVFVDPSTLTGFQTQTKGRYIAVILPISVLNDLTPPPGGNGPGFIIEVDAAGAVGPAFYRLRF